MVTIPTGNHGMASYATDTFDVVELFGGDTPAVVTESVLLLDQNAALPAYTVVGRISATGKVTICNPGASNGSEDPIGITTAAALDVNADQTIAIFTSGCFNIAALNWHSGFSTEAAKLAAFAGKTNGAIKLVKVSG